MKLLPILGHSVGVHKAAGYASHLANLYCSFFWGKLEDLEKMHIGKIRTAEEVFKTSQLWKDAKTLNQREEIMKLTGVQWSEFNRLKYCDPVKDKPLGMMYNWLEGVLQHHFCFRWGFVVYSKEQKADIKCRASKGVGVGQRKRVIYSQGQGNVVDPKSEGEGSAGYNDEEVEEKDNQGDYGDYGDAELEEGLDVELFTEVNIVLFCEQMLNIVVPRGVSKMPVNLGESKHGSLRAAKWYSLFAFIIPLIVLEIYVNDVEKLCPDTNQGQILKNIGYLVQCTNLVFSRRASEWEANNFKICYHKYHETSKQIFGQLEIKPNHHYALHIPNQM